MYAKKRGQSVLEYVIVLTAVIAAIVAGAITLGSTDSSKGLGKLFFNSGQKIVNASVNISQIGQ